MTEDEDMVSRHQVLTMPLAAWRALGEYLTVIDYDRRSSRGQSYVNYTQVAGAILTKFLIEHAHEIRRDAEDVRLATIKESLPHFYTPAQLTAISSASRTDIPDIYRIDSPDRYKPSRAQALRSLRRVAKGPQSPVARLVGKSGKVRRRRRGSRSGPDSK